MKYYVVSQDELEAYANARASRDLSIGKENQYEMDRLCSVLKATSLACRAREVPEWATHFTGNLGMPSMHKYKEIVR
jgi:hypothetical protein